MYGVLPSIKKARYLYFTLILPVAENRVIYCSMRASFCVDLDRNKTAKQVLKRFRLLHMHIGSYSPV